MRRFILLCLLFPLWLQAKELIIGGTLEPPLKYLDAQGVPHGLDVDVVSTMPVPASAEKSVRCTSTP